MLFECVDRRSVTAAPTTLVLLNAESVKRLVTIATALVAGAVAVAAFGFPQEYGFEPDYRPEADCAEEPCRATGR